MGGFDIVEEGAILPETNIKGASSPPDATAFEDVAPPEAAATLLKIF